MTKEEVRAMASRKIILLAYVSAVLTICTPLYAEDIKATLQILSVAPVSGDIEVRVEIRNTGSKSHDFPVGCSLQRKNGTWLDIPYQLHRLDPSEEKFVTFRGSSLDAREFSLARAAIWHRAKPDGLLETRYDMDEADVDE